MARHRSRSKSRSRRRVGRPRKYRSHKSKSRSRKSHRRSRRRSHKVKHRYSGGACGVYKKVRDCGGQPNCQWTKRGCRSRRGTVSKGVVYEGPSLPPSMYYY